MIAGQVPAAQAETDRSSGQVTTAALLHWLQQQLSVSAFKDYCPNGLQVEGKPVIRRILTAVTASEAALREAADWGADALLVHHGWFWRGEDPVVRGTRRTRLRLALEQELNLIAYHLPLDAHEQWGNNAQLARVLGLTPLPAPEGRCGPDGLIWLGQAAGVDTLGALGQQVSDRLDRQAQVIGDASQPVHRIAWCTGAAQSMLQAAIDAGADAFITGEISEPTVHLARESGVGFISAGHHATERYGVKALGEAIAAQFGVSVRFVDLDNPV
ncbi:MAG: Nif3-like dinuclear metal center hexameric protein [Pigmentiphaga sp.]|nr:Nif3-like dinuclear metal center hexameric protein [Pigmentiphaga sp.]